MIYYCDNNRHLICIPYSVENLHLMARDLNINKCWFHNKVNKWHYDIPKSRILEIQSKCTIITSRELLNMIRNDNQY